MTTPVALSPISRLDGEVRVPGDKSISHRALIIGALARGRTYLSGLAPGDDVAHTASCLEACGVYVRVHADGRAMVEGSGPELALSQPRGPLDCANSGSTMRMLSGPSPAIRSPPSWTATHHCAAARCAASPHRSRRWARRFV